MKICFGIPSWLPDISIDRQLRIDRLNRLFAQIEKLWPDIPVLIVAQNWREYRPETKLTLDIDYYDRLGILKARQLLREKFLNLGYDYIIMFDDDAIIECDNDKAHLDYIQCIENHPDGFAFIHGKGSSPFTPYADSQLNLCAISRSVYLQVPLPNVDPQKSQAFEDRIFSTYLHCVYAEKEFEFPATIRCIHFKNPNESAPSTWSKEKQYNWRKMRENTRSIEHFIYYNKTLPNFRVYW